MSRGGCFAFATWFVACACPVAAQQSIDYASVSGRVTDPSGAVVIGAQVAAAAHGNQCDRRGRDRFGGALPFSLPTRRSVRDHGAAAGISGATRTLTSTAGAAFELPVTLNVGGVDTNVTVTGGATVLEAARSQIAGTVSEPEVRILPMNGRNFLELALLVPGVSPTNVASTQLFPETSAVPGRQPLGRQPAQSLEQLHRRRAVGQR